MSGLKRRVGIVGFGSLGEFLFENIQKSADMEVAFVWNRSKAKLRDLPSSVTILDEISDISDIQSVDLVVEVSHPWITKQFGQEIVRNADFMIGSPTALADPTVLDDLAICSEESKHGIYVPSGALWGAEDIRRMASLGTLKSLTVSMTKQPESFKLETPLKEENLKVCDTAKVLFEGPVGDLCKLAPNNVNTMAAAAVAAHSLGFEGTTGRLIADPSLGNWHLVEIAIEGNDGFVVNTIRKNPARTGAVTGQATYHSFLSSLNQASGKGPGIHMC